MIFFSLVCALFKKKKNVRRGLPLFPDAYFFWFLTFLLLILICLLFEIQSEIVFPTRKHKFIINKKRKCHAKQKPDQKKKKNFNVN
jgi:predicted membrane protein